jgi:hypothetical protein
LSPAVDEVIARGLSKRPEDRYRTAAELVEQTRRALAAPSAVVVEPNGRRRSGETVVDPAVLRAAPVVEVGEEPRGRWRRIVIAALVILGLALLGFALGRASRKDGSAGTGIAAAGPVSLRFPDSDWRPAAPGSIPGLRLSGAVSLASTRVDHPGTLIAGMAPDAQGAGLLPRALKSQLTGASTPHAVAIGPYEGLVYHRLPVAHLSSRLDLVLVPTNRGAAAVACVTPGARPAWAKPADCDAVAATLRLHGLRAVSLGPAGLYAGSVVSALARLDGERVAGRRQLDGAGGLVDQARAAHLISAAYAGAATTILDAKPSPLVRPAHLALYGSLREAQRAYAALAAAARAGDGAAYRRASLRTEAAERKVSIATTRLERLRP